MTRECYPLFSSLKVNETHCDATVGEKVYLPDFLPCSVICFGEWGALGKIQWTIDACDNSFTFSQDEEACFKYDYVPEASNPYADCSAFHVEICITLTIKPFDELCPTDVCDPITVTKQ